MLRGLCYNSFMAVCKLLYNEYCELFPNIAKLDIIAAEFPVSSVPYVNKDCKTHRSKNIVTAERCLLNTLFIDFSTSFWYHVYTAILYVLICMCF